MRILYIGPDYKGSNGTCWRDAFIELGHDVYTLNSESFTPLPSSILGKLCNKLVTHPPKLQTDSLNKRISEAFQKHKPELCFFIQAKYVYPETLEYISKHSIKFVYMNDDMFNPDNQSFTFFDIVPKMDCILTTKSYNVPEYYQAGAKHSLYIPNAYDPNIHYPAEINTDDKNIYSGDISFVGTFRSERADYLARIFNVFAVNRLNIWGGGWEKANRPIYWHKKAKWRIVLNSVRGKELWCGEMGKAFQLNHISLGLLNHRNRDLHTSRSFEIPACQGFMLAERTEEHQLYFEEDKEAVYFSSDEELLSKLRFYINNKKKRDQIAKQGYIRCLRSDYKYLDRARTALAEYHKLRK